MAGPSTAPGPQGPDPVVPDTRDWTWVLERRCPDCGFEADAYQRADLPSTITANAESFARVLETAGERARRRPDPGTWSPLEYAAHVRDVHRVFEGRARLMLDQEDPQFPNWDQDAAAVAEGYHRQDPVTVSAELGTAARTVAETYASLDDAGWSRPGRRSNGSRFTVDSLARYHLHDVVHHLHDVGFDPRRATITAYDHSAERYRDGILEPPESVLQLVARFVRLLPDGARVLEIGSGPGRDAALLEASGLRVRRTDVTPGFVELMRSQGHQADLVDPLTDDLRDPADPGGPGGEYDGVWASASLLHVARADLRAVLARLADVTRPGGVLHVSVKEGDGEAWSTHGNVGAPRLFTSWRAAPLTAAAVQAGWDVVDVDQGVAGPRGESWLDLIGRRR